MPGPAEAIDGYHPNPLERKKKALHLWECRFLGIRWLQEGCRQVMRFVTTRPIRKVRLSPHSRFYVEPSRMHLPGLPLLPSLPQLLERWLLKGRLALSPWKVHDPRRQLGRLRVVMQ
jgi:hypothetical protein